MIESARTPLILALLSSAAFAQGADAGVAVPPSDTDAEAPASDAPNELRPDSERIGWLQGKLESLEEQYVETKNDVLTFKKLKFSGYVQARYQYTDSTPPLSQFSVRRARLKAEYQGDWARFMLQLDAMGGADFIRDAEAALSEPFSGKQYLSLTAGLTKVPFGVEVPVSSVDREFPERSRAARSFFPGERDRGVKLTFHYKFLWAYAGIFDGNFTQMVGYTTKDNDTEKDVTMRVMADFRWIAIGASGVVGQTLKPADVVTGSAARYLPRNRIGFDAQLYLDLFPFGGTALVGEFVAGTSYWVNGVERPGQTALGWYVLLVQNILQHEQIAVRYDFFDPATGTVNKPDGADPTKPAGLNQIHTIGFLATHYFDDVFKLSLVYELPIVFVSGQGDVAPRQNLFTVQMQAKF